MTLATKQHPEDLKAALRKRFGSVLAFEAAADLPRRSVSNFLRGRSNSRVADAINSVLSKDAAALASDNVDDSADGTATHRLNSQEN